MACASYSLKQTLLPSQEAPRKETPQERIKRLMAAQINKRIADEAVNDTKRRLAAEKEMAARIHVGRVLRCE